MDMSILRAVKKRVFIYYCVFFALFSILLSIFMLAALGVAVAAPILIMVCAIALPVLAAFYVVYYRILNKIEKSVDQPDVCAELINKAPRTGLIIIAPCCLGGSVAGVIIGVFFGYFSSFQQGGFLLIVGLVIAGVVSTAFYYFSKTYIYRLKKEIDILPLSLFYKLMIPLIDVVMIIFIIAAAGIYRTNFSQIYSMYSKEISAKVDAHSRFVSSIFDNAAHQLIAVAHSDIAINGQRDQLRQLLYRLHKTRDVNVESFFYADAAGNTTTSFETKEVNVVGREYFVESMKTGKTVISGPCSEQI